MPSTPDGFQTFVNNELPIGVVGDFVGASIRASVPAPPGGFVASSQGVLVGNWAWGNPATGIASNTYQLNSSGGFVHRENNGLITQFLGFNTLTVLPGNMITLMAQGDYFAAFAAAATVGQKVYADPVTGALSAGATGGGVTANSTAASVANTGVLTVGATLTGTLAAGQGVTGVGLPPGSYIGSQISGSTGSTGTYQLLNSYGAIASGSWPVVSSETINFYGVIETPFYMASNVKVNAAFTASLAAPVSPAVNGILTVTAVGGGVLEPGQFLTATGGGGLANSLNVQIISDRGYTHPPHTTA